MTQPDLFDQPRPKMSRQCKLIYELFKQQGGRATNVEIARIALKYTNRISELRLKHGLSIEMVEKRPHGVRVYELREA